jgi:ATP-binding protein involved in chromosome partitioning
MRLAPKIARGAICRCQNPVSLYSPAMPLEDAHRPTRIEQHDPQNLVIDWADGGQSLIDVRALRLACGCAHCIDEWSGQPLLAPESVATDIAPVGIQSVGLYAIQIEWNDGHNTGIYPFARLRVLADQGTLASTTPNPRGDDV